MRTRLIPLLPILVLPAAVAAQTPPPIYVAPVVPPALRLLEDPAVQKEIGLNGAQTVAAERVRRGWSASARGIHLGWFGMVPPEVFRVGADARTADFLKNGLTKDQRTRLNQILFQLREKEFGPHQALAMAARDLGLRGDQMEDVRNLKVQRVEAIDQAVTSGKRFEKVKVEVQATNGDTFEKMAEMLTRAQRERLKELRGKPFVGQRPLDGQKPLEKRPVGDKAAVGVAAPAEPGDRTPNAKYPASKPGLYDLELKYLDNLAMGRELKLTDGQSGRVARAWLGFPAERVGGGKVGTGKEDEVHEYTEKALTDILTPAQRTRFNEIMMQRRARVSPEAACTYPPTTAALKLTPAQLQQLSAGKRLADVLSKDQLTRYRQLLGAPFDLPVVWDDYLPVKPAPPAPALVPVQSAPYAAARDFLRLTDRLGLSAEQIKKLRELAEDEPKIRELIHKELSLEDTPPITGAGRAVTVEKAVADRYQAAVEQQCWDTLDPAQQSIARKIFGRGR